MIFVFSVVLDLDGDDFDIRDYPGEAASPQGCARSDSARPASAGEAVSGHAAIGGTPVAGVGIELEREAIAR